MALIKFVNENPLYLTNIRATLFSDVVTLVSTVKFEFLLADYVDYQCSKLLFRILNINIS